MGNRNASMAGQRETISEKKGQRETVSEKKGDGNPLLTDSEDSLPDSEDWLTDSEDFLEFAAHLNVDSPSAADLYGHFGVMAVLFETPSGFGIFQYDAVKLRKSDAWQHVWADFINDIKAVIWLDYFVTFEGKGPAITNTYLSPDLSSMILKSVCDDQTLAVGKEEYKNIIEDRLNINCLYCRDTKELMWGLRFQIRHFLPVENSEMTNDDRFPMSEGMIFFLNSHKFDINPHMMVTTRIIQMVGTVYECDRCVDKFDPFLRLYTEKLMKISGIRTCDWDLLKLATALKMICEPEDEIPDARQLFTKQELQRLMEDAPRYKCKISKDNCLIAYKEMYAAHKIRLDVSRKLDLLFRWAKEAYENELAGIAASDPEIGPDRKKICRGFAPVMIDELTEGQVTPTTTAVDTQISSHPLNMTNRPGVLSMDIHPSKYRPDMQSLETGH
uniref:Uncharacterized protein n=1 Tax=Avena sativa TaxID=4498 RepID=A0ACD5U0G1_AVESA